MLKFFSCIICTLLLFTAQANAQATIAATPPVYAVLSLVGDQLGVVVAQSRPELNFAPYRRDVLLINNSLFDERAISAAGIAIRKVVPNAELSALNTRSAVLFDKQHVLFEEKGSVISVPDAIKAALQQQKATYLVLVTKHRDEMKLRFENSRSGSDKLEGLGFYVDDTAESGARASGFIAPYAYLRVALIDTKTGNVIARQTITASGTIPSTGVRDAKRQWFRMSAEEKAQSVDKLLQAEISRVIPLLLKAG